MGHLRRRRRRHPRTEAPAQRGHPGAQLPDAGNLPRRRRHRRRQPAARARSHQGRCRHHRARRRALHGRDGKAAESGKDRADPRPRGRLFARGLDHRAGRAADAPALSRRARRHLCQHVGRGEGGIRHLLHLGQRAQGRGVARRRARHHAAGRISGAEHRRADRREDHRLEGPLRGARAVHADRRPADCAKIIPA